MQDACDQGGWWELHAPRDEAPANEPCRPVFEGYQRAAACNELNHVFFPREDGPFIGGSCHLLKFSAAYTKNMRDMRSAGVASLHTGIPLWLLPERSSLKLINMQFNGKDIISWVPFLLNVSAPLSGLAVLWCGNCAVLLLF
jgi:hypothetical protein